MTISFDGVDMAYSIPDISGLTYFSIFLNFVERSEISNAVLFSWNDGSNTNIIGYAPYWLSAFGLFTVECNGTGNYTAVNKPSTGTLYNMAIIRNATSASLYLNGSLATSNITGITNTSSFTAPNIRIGCHYDGAANTSFANTYISEVAIYNYNLPPSEVIEIAKTRCPPTVRKANLIRYIPFVNNAVDYAGKVTTTAIGSPTFVGHHPIIRNRHSPTSSYKPPTPVLLMHFNGEDGSNTFIDATSKHNITVYNHTQIDTAQSQFGGASALFDGTDDYLALDGSSDFAFGTGDFTIDFWFRFNIDDANYMNFYTGSGAGGIDTFPIIHKNTTKKLGFYSNSAERITGTTTLTPAGGWYHVAVTRSSGQTRMFLNGVQEGSTYADSVNYTIDANAPQIGRWSGATSYLNGWMDELRVIKGYAVWTKNFTPPTKAYQV